MTLLTINKRADFDYDIVERFKAGIELNGHEVRSAKKGRIDLTGGSAIIRDNEIFLVGLEIPSFQPNNSPPGYDALRTRRLLLKRDEIRYLAGKLQSGFKLLPLKAYVERGLIKIELGLGRIRKKQDRRELIKKREALREIRKFEKL